ncbi:MAG: hypothetical protein ACOZCE_00615 [Spirochaetota bacterium]
MILNIAIIVFILLELTNVVIMYVKPDFTYGNSMASFEGWERAKQDEKNYLYSKYLVNWVANCKLIFIVLLLNIVIFGNEASKIVGVVVTIVSIGIYYITLHPIISKLDEMGEIRPKGYSKTLGLMIAGFMIMFSVALIFYFIFK